MGLSKEKREIRRMEQAVKTTFIVDTFKIFMDAYQKTLGDSRYGLSLKITVRNNNHYLVFEDFGQRFAINVYTNGNVEIRMRERNHCVYREQLFAYTPDIEEQGEFQRYLEDGLAVKIVEVALERIASYGEFMDILFEGVRFVEAYDYFRFEKEIERSVG